MEIERKFLVCSMPDLSECASAEISQGYLSFSPEIRIRKMGSQCFLAQKGDGTLEREEEEPEIKEAAYSILSVLIIGNLIMKTRYRMPLNDGLVAELDIYHGKLEGLSTVEVEFGSRPAAEDFSPPEWFGQDVTADKRYKNKNLAQCDDINPLLQKNQSSMGAYLKRLPV